MKNFIQEGKCVQLTAPGGGVTSGTGYIVGGLFVVASHDADATEKFVGCTEGIYSLPKEATTVTFAEGEICYWDVADAEFNDSASGNYAVGTCVEAAGATDATVKVKLVGTAVAAGA